MKAYEKALRAFPDWMNRPLNRVHVYTYSIARMILGPSVSLRFRARPQYRDFSTEAQRISVALYIQQRRQRRSLGRIKLPIYQESTGTFKEVA